MLTTRFGLAPRPWFCWMSNAQLGITAAVALVMSANGCRPAKRTQAAVGEDLFAVAEDALLELTYRTPTARVSVQRFAASAPYQVMLSTAAGRFEQCPASPEVVGSLKALGTLSVEAVLPSPSSVSLAGELLLFGPTPGEPFHAGVLPAVPGRSGLGLQVYGTAYRVSVPQQALDRLLLGCSQAAGSASP